MVSDKLFDRACNDLQAQTKKVFELVQTHNALLASHATLVEAVAWERECGTVSFTDLWFDEWNRTEDQSKSAMRELRLTRRAAQAEVDRLLGDIK